MKIELGQKLYRDNKSGIKEYTVTKLGRKFFYCNNNTREGISFEDLTYRDANYSQYNYTLYLSDKEILDKHESDRIYAKLMNCFSYRHSHKYTLEQLQQVYNILNLE